MPGAECLRCGEDLQRPRAQRHAVLSVELHPRSRNSPLLPLHVGLVPPGPARAPTERDQGEAAGAAFLPPAAENEPLNPAVGPGRLDQKVQALLITVPPRRGG